MATRLITPFCAASALIAALMAEGALPVSWPQAPAIGTAEPQPSRPVPAPQTGPVVKGS